MDSALYWKMQNIKTRISQHLFSKLGISPFALKLKNRKNLDDELFKLKVLELKMVNYNVIVTHIERTL